MTVFNPIKAVIVAALALLAAQGMILLAAEPTPPEATIRRCQAAPKIDGVLDDACWKTAAELHTDYTVGAPASARKHTARVTCDDEWLYVAFDVAHPASDRQPAKFLNHDDNVQREDNVQLSFDPGTSGKVYYQFLVNKANTRADFRMTREKGREREGWNIPWRSATTQDETGWKAEIALPFSLLITHGDLRRARFNLIVDSFIVLLDDAKIPVGLKREETSWAPLVRDFNEPERFGLLKGLDDMDFRAPFLPFLSNPKVTPYDSVNGGYAYGISADLQALSGKSGKVRLTVVDRPSLGNSAETVQDVEVKGNGSASVRIAVPATSLGRRDVAVRVSDPNTGEVLQTFAIPDTSALDLFAAFLDRSYYTSEDSAAAVCRIGLPAEALRGMMLVAKDAHGKVLGKSDTLSALTRLSFPIGALAVGEHAVTVTLGPKAGGTASSAEMRLIKKTPRPGFEIKVERERNVLLKNGEPFFPYGFFMMHIRQDADWAFKELGEAGFNTVLEWSEASDPAKDTNEYLAVAAKYGLQVLSHPSNYAADVDLSDPNGVLKPGDLEKLNKQLTGNLISMKGHLVSNPILKNLTRAEKTRFFVECFEKNLPRYLAVIQNAQQHDNLLGYTTFDEPLLAHIDQQVAGRMFYAKANELDGYRPVFLLYNSVIPQGDIATDWADVIGTDSYIVPAGNPYYGFDRVTREVLRNRQRLDAEHKVTYSVLIGEFYSGAKKRIISGPEQRCQTYLALIHGAKAIFYFIYPPSSHAVFNALKDIAAELKVLGPALLAPEVEHTIAYSPDAFDLASEKFTDVQAVLRRNPSGGYILLCANKQWYPVDTTFTSDLFAKAGVVTRLFPDKVLPVKGGSFSERIEPHGTRAYAIAELKETGKPVEISIKMDARKELATPEAPAPEWRVPPGKKNMVNNASLEEDTIPGWPDWYRSLGPLTAEQRIGGSDNVWGLTNENPWHGKRCLKMTVKEELDDQRVMYTYVQADIVEPTQYVASVYLRADRPGLKVRFRVQTGAGAENQELELTPSWKRYSMTCVIPPTGMQTAFFSVWLRGDNLQYGAGQRAGTVWVDALQFEKGSEPTAFEP